MHYKNGREAKNGDKVVLIPSYGSPVIGILYDAAAGNDYCNGKIAPIAPSDPCPNLKEVLHRTGARIVNTVLITLAILSSVDGLCDCLRLFTDYRGSRPRGTTTSTGVQSDEKVREQFLALGFRPRWEVARGKVRSCS